MAGPKHISIPVPYDGLDTDTAPDAMPLSRSRIHQNWLPGYKGKLPLRGAAQHVTAHHDGTETGVPIAALVHGDKLLIVRRKQDATAIIDPWKEPYMRQTSASALSLADADAAVIDLNAATSSAATFANANLYPGPRSTRVGNYVYAIGFDTTSADLGVFTEVDGRVYKTPYLLRWDGTTGSPVLYESAPRGAQDVTLHYQRLFMLGGAVNLIPNPGAELDTTGWTPTNCTLATSSTQVYRGSNSLRLTAGAAIINVDTDYMGIAPGAKWEFTVQVRAGSNAQNCIVQTTYRSASGSTFLGPASASTPISTGAWTQITVSGTAPAHSGGTVPAEIKVNISFGPACVGGNLFYVDAATFLVSRSPNTLFYSDPLAEVLPDTQAAWRDDASGLLNQIVVEGSDKDDYGVGLARVGGTLVIFKRKSIHVLNGYSAATFNVRAVTRELGCIDPNSICEYDNGVIFMSQRGLMFFDGVDMTTLSEGIHQNITPTSAGITNLAVANNRANAQDLIQVSTLPGDYVMVSNSLNCSTPSNPRPDSIWSGYVNMKAGGWSRFESDAMDAQTHPLFAVRTTNHHVLVTDRDVFKADTMAAPEADTTITHRYHDTDRSGTRWPVIGTFTTRPVNIGSPFHKGQLASVGVDYHVLRQGADPGDAVLQLALEEDFTGNAIATFSNIDADDDTPAGHFRRWIAETFGEVTSVRVTVTTALGAADDAEPLRYAEVQAIHLEVQTPTHRRVSD